MNKAVFLDRDGVINNDEGKYYIYNPEQFVINNGILESIALLKKHQFLVIVISNQGGIGRGLYTKEDTEKIHQLFVNTVKKNGGNIDEIYYCPHHESTGNCFCRKPNSLLIEKAIARFKIDKKNAYFIGDSPRDIEAANKAEIIGILIQKNSNIIEICRKLIYNQLG